MSETMNKGKRRREELALIKSNKQLERNKCWDELNGFHATCAGMLFQHKAIAELSADKDLHKYLADPRTMVMNIQSLAKDLQALNEELGLLQAQHKDKTGGARTPEELMHSFTIAEQYNLFMERHNGVVLPTVYYILEGFQQAEDRRNAAQAAQSPAATGPIDVEFRDTPAAEAAVAAPATGGAEGYTLQ